MTDPPLPRVVLTVSKLDQMTFERSPWHLVREGMETLEVIAVGEPLGFELVFA